MLREMTRKKEDLDEYLRFFSEALAADEAKISQPDRLLPVKKMSVATEQFSTVLSLMVARYSRGDDLTALRDDLPILLEQREKLLYYCDILPDEDQPHRVMYERIDDKFYIEYCRWLTFAACLGIDQAHINRALELIDNAGVDALFDRIAIALGDSERPVAEILLYLKPYAPLYEALDAAPAQQGKLIKKFLDGYAKTVYKWGLSFISMPDDDGPYHTGNWCFEAALVVKLFNIDDSAFRDHPLYPAALIHGDPA
ncbi:PoNe immunity protein domain-containing protein [Vreelandella alkaliphila]|uniref:PoNe immunity protein domain-containing protein n=1 Tax=Vreelandella alkaliphila TaxID=272774 RepID=UPI003FD6DB13